MPCRYQQSPIIEALHTEWGDSVLVRSIDAIAQNELATHYGVLSVPTTVVISSEGRIVTRNTGVVTATKLRQQLAEANHPVPIDDTTG